MHLYLAFNNYCAIYSVHSPPFIHFSGVSDGWREKLWVWRILFVRLILIIRCLVLGMTPDPWPFQKNVCTFIKERNGTERRSNKVRHTTHTTFAVCNILNATIQTGQSYFWLCLKAVSYAHQDCIYLIKNSNKTVILWSLSWIFSIITSVFSVTWFFRNHFNMLISCSSNVSYYFVENCFAASYFLWKLWYFFQYILMNRHRTAFI